MPKQAEHYTDDNLLWANKERTAGHGLDTPGLVFLLSLIPWFGHPWTSFSVAPYSVVP